MKDSDVTTNVILLNGFKSLQPSIKEGPGVLWYRDHYDDGDQNPIAFYLIQDEAFDRGSVEQARDGSEYSISLKSVYRENPHVIFAIHDLLNRANGIRKV